ncbi:hypothetical protein [uncultured Caballeronia sp.]|jgi:hypothetical protein|uniref:hypothetical protein n=1 Tax=uncultured Caballeronia sp. TaxID=1827198 RepID=UPI00157645CB
MKTRILIAACMLTTPVLANAACEEFLESWTQKLHPNRALDSEYVTCKPWPANPALTLAVLPLPAKGSDSDTGTYDLELLVADSGSGSIIAHSYQTSAITYDAMLLSGISLDTARYQLMPENRAFGVRISHSGSSRVNPYDTTSLSLYVIDGQRLKPVLDRLTVEERGGEWDGQCSGEFNSTSRTIDVGPAGVDGYAALKILEKSKKSTNVSKNGNCSSKDSPVRRTSFVLQHRDGRYIVPKNMQSD